MSRNRDVYERLVMVLIVFVFLLLSWLLSACTTFVPIEIDTPVAKLPQECKVGSRPWAELQGGSKKAIAQTWVRNRKAYRDLRYRHAVCRKFAAQQVK